MKQEPQPGAPLQPGSYKLPKADSLFIPHQPNGWSWLPGEGSARGRESVCIGQLWSRVPLSLLPLPIQASLSWER